MIMFKNESRPDIAVSLSRTAFRGAARYISHLIYPTLPTAELGGTISVAQNLLATAVAGRAHGAALGSTQAAQVVRTYALTKTEGRATLDENDVKGCGGEEKAIASGARTAGRAVMFASEAASAATLISVARQAAATEIAPTAPFAALAAAARSVKDYGTPVLVCSESWLGRYVSIAGVALTLRSLYGDRILTDLLADVDTALKAVGQVFGVRRILVGDDRAWTSSTYAAVIGWREEAQVDPLVVKAEPSYGIGPIYLPDPANPEAPFEIETGYNVATKVNVVDATIYWAPLECNAAGAVCVSLPAELNPALDVNVINNIGPA